MQIRSRSRSLADNPQLLGLLLTLPALIAILAVVLIPIFSSFLLSLQQKDLSRPQYDAFIGFKNYLTLLRDSRYLNSLWVTFRFSLTSVILEVILGVSIALVLNQRFVGRGFVRGLMILPWAMPSIVNAAMWKWIYNADYGALNALLTQLHLIDSYRVWLADPTWATILIILANVWKETPFTVILVLAALQAIPEDLYEAARVDGASAWRSFWHITLPLISPVLMVAAMLQFIWGFQTFELVYVTTGGGPFSTTELTTLRIYATTFRSLRFGYGAAMAYLTSLVILIPAVFYVRSAYRRVVEM
ncbi:sugar ABC transporter permease [Thermanaerothrix sp.]|jgi:ABC-type sugar transport system permease subunit|uniref:carbohydrate ABC transporter permease n=1 Tax=Thermanaerothrix sp. TaxID=2972675 RepID=UPI002ADD3704|nr:sugar ABC transporter permease [Thermanaerothrix sp.]